jgi:hypothetical protein
MWKIRSQFSSPSSKINSAFLLLSSPILPSFSSSFFFIHVFCGLRCARGPPRSSWSPFSTLLPPSAFSMATLCARLLPLFTAYGVFHRNTNCLVLTPISLVLRHTRLAAALPVSWFVRLSPLVPHPNGPVPPTLA